jgi:hypothetical protein
MTTTVSISVSGNEQVLVKQISESGNPIAEHRIAAPGGSVSLGIHGKQRIEIGEEKVLAAPDDFALPAKACDLGRPEGCESCQ